MLAHTSRNSPLSAQLHLWTKYSRATEGSPAKAAAWTELQAEITVRDRLSAALKGVAAAVVATANTAMTAESIFTARPAAGKPIVSDWACYKASIQAFHTACGDNIPQPVAKDFGLFANACNVGVPVSVISAHVSTACAAQGF